MDLALNKDSIDMVGLWLAGPFMLRGHILYDQNRPWATCKKFLQQTIVPCKKAGGE